MAGLLLFMLIALALVLIAAIAATFHIAYRPPRRTAGWAVAHDVPTDVDEIGLPVELEQIDAGDVPLELWRIPGERADGPVFLLVHGWADSRYGLWQYVPALRSIASALVLFDQPGHGESRARRARWGRHATAIIAQVGQHVGKTTGRPLILLGASSGGAIAMQACDACGAAGVIVDAPVCSIIGGSARIAAGIGLPLWPGLVALWLVRRISGGRWPWLDPAIAAARVGVPVMVIESTDDTIAQPDDARRVADAAADGHRVVFEKTGHLAAARSDPNRFAQAVDDWLASRGPDKNSAAPVGRTGSAPYNGVQ